MSKECTVESRGLAPAGLPANRRHRICCLFQREGGYPHQPPSKSCREEVAIKAIPRPLEDKENLQNNFAKATRPALGPLSEHFGKAGLHCTEDRCCRRGRLRVYLSCPNILHQQQPPAPPTPPKSLEAKQVFHTNYDHRARECRQKKGAFRRPQVQLPDSPAQDFTSCVRLPTQG